MKTLTLFLAVASFSGALLAQTVSPLAVTMGSDGGAWALSVTATTTWTAASNAGFLHILGNPRGSGSGTLLFSADANSAASSRSGTLTVAGQTVTVTQNPKYLSGSPVTITPATFGIDPNSALQGDSNHRLYFAVRSPIPSIQVVTTGAPELYVALSAISPGLPGLSTIFGFAIDRPAAILLANPAGDAAQLCGPYSSDQGMVASEELDIK